MFEAPWQSRAFGLAIALHDAGAIDFEEFRERLVAEIAAHELEHGTDGDGATTSTGWTPSSTCSESSSLWRLRRSASAPPRSRTPGRTTMTISTSTVMSTPTPASTGSRGRSRDDHCGECLDGGADRRPADRSPAHRRRWVFFFLVLFADGALIALVFGLGSQPGPLHELLHDGRHLRGAPCH